MDNNTEYTMFHICTTEDKFSVYYNYKDNNFYGCHYQPDQTQSVPFTWHYLAIPIALALCYLLNHFFQTCPPTESFLAIVAFFIGISFLSMLTFDALLKNGQRQMNHQLQKLDLLSKDDISHYLAIGRKQFPKQLLTLGLLFAGMLGLLALFLLTKNVIFLLVLTLIYFIAYLLWIAYRPFKKARFFRDRN
ncbi:MAG: hypothetical protein E7256_14315 [Lachnospiraceae bacterium]|nr:hypothetical protein [Lachnospiraceae bacterium]